MTERSSSSAHDPAPPDGDAVPRGTLFVVGFLVLTILAMWFLVYGVLAARS